MGISDKKLPDRINFRGVRLAERQKRRAKERPRFRAVGKHEKSSPKNGEPERMEGRESGSGSIQISGRMTSSVDQPEEEGIFSEVVRKGNLSCPADSFPCNGFSRYQ